MPVKQYYDRYGRWKRGNNTISPNIPFIKLNETSSWKQEIYAVGETRLDVLADKYYSDPNLGWVILLVNRDQFNGGLEFSPVEDRVVIKIPFPKAEVLGALSSAYENYVRYYGT